MKIDISNSCDSIPGLFGQFGRFVIWPITLMAALLFAISLCLTPASAVVGELVAQDDTANVDDSIQDGQASVSDPVTDLPGDGSFYSFVGEAPAWVTRGQYVDTENQAEYLVVQSEPRLRQREAENELKELLVKTVRDRVDEMFEPGAGRAIGIDLDYVMDNLIQHNEKCRDNGIYHQLLHWKVPESNREMLGSDSSEAFQCFAQIRFDNEFENRVAIEWQNSLVVSRTMQTGLIALSTLLVLALAFGYFTADHKTRGFYSRRLQTLGIGCLLVSVAVIWWLTTRFAWL